MRDLPGPYAGLQVKGIKVFPGDDRTAVAVISAFTNSGAASHNVFQTTNRGQTWTDISGNLPNLPVWTATFRGDSIKTVYVGADDGVYVTTNGGVKWSRAGSGLPHTQVFDMQFDPALGVLAVATNGCGIWEIALTQ